MKHNGQRYAAVPLLVFSIFSVYECTKISKTILLFTTNCGMQYERMLATGFYTFYELEMCLQSKR